MDKFFEVLGVAVSGLVVGLIVGAFRQRRYTSELIARYHQTLRDMERITRNE